VAAADREAAAGDDTLGVAGDALPGRLPAAEERSSSACTAAAASSEGGCGVLALRSSGWQAAAWAVAWGPGPTGDSAAAGVLRAAGSAEVGDETPLNWVL